MFKYVYSRCHDNKIRQYSETWQQWSETLRNQWLTVRQTAETNDWCEQRAEHISYLGQRQKYRATGAVAHCHEELCMTSLSKAKLDCNKWCFVTGLDWIAQCFTSSPTQYRLYGRRFLQVKRPNQQYQSTEGKSTKDKSNNGNNTKHTCRDNNRDEKQYT